MSVRFPIVKPVLPDIQRYTNYIESAFDRCWLTNNGPLVQELEAALCDYLGVKHLMLVANGTLALQVAYQALDVEGRAATTPFSFAATASSLVWQNISPTFVDIEPETFTVSPNALDKIFATTSDMSAFVGVHVFGNAGDVEGMDTLAAERDIKVVYDAAHAFGIKLNGNSLLNYGDASTLSLHATKVFHTVEGGAIVFRDKAMLENARQLVNFGFNSQGSPETVGINAKMSEMHAAMGLALLPMVDDIIAHRSALTERYRQLLHNELHFQHWNDSCSQNGAYMPVLFESEAQLLRSTTYLTQQGVQTRRYFYPSLSEVIAYGKHEHTPVSADISRRILCLPMYADLSMSDVSTICELVKQSLRQ